MLPAAHLDRLMAHFSAEQERTRDLMRAAMSATDRGSRLQGARNLPVPQASALLWGGSGRLVGWSVRVRGGTALVTLYDGRDNTAPQVAAFSMANNGEAVGSSAQWIGPGGTSITEALYIEITVIGGAPVLGGAIYFGATD